MLLDVFRRSVVECAGPGDRPVVFLLWWLPTTVRVRPSGPFSDYVVNFMTGRRLTGS